MFKKIPGGKKEVIDTNAGYKVDVWIPPLGYGFNTLTAEIERTDIIKRSNKASEQYWERVELPADWKKKRAAEKLIQEGNKDMGIKPNPDYVDTYLESIREKHWKYRLCGVWVYMNGTPVYITGEHWMFLNWWAMNIGYGDYRDSDRRRYYFQEYCVHDDRCAGIMEAANRRSGKTARAGLFLYNYTSVTPESMAGIQSKTDPDAKSILNKAVVIPFKKLPDFFRPEVDTSGGDSFGSEIRFKKMTKRGKGALEDMDELGLNSIIDYRASKESAYDGEPLRRCFHDEVGKECVADAYARWVVARYCMVIGKKWIGKAILTTTPEEIKGMSIENTPFYRLWHDSDPRERDGNGHTKTGLYAYYIPAWENLEVDKYGMPKKEENLTFIMNRREALKGNMKKYLDEVKKNTITVAEMFKATLNNNCLYNAENLSNRLDVLSYSKDHYVRGNFSWEGGIQDSNVIFSPSTNGRWMILKTFISEDFESNLVERRGDICIPKNYLKFTMGVDPFDHDDTVDKNRKSKGCIAVHQKFNPHEWLESNNACVCLYLFRPPTARLFYEDVIMTAVWFGGDILFETQKIGIKGYIEERGYSKFLIKLAGNEKPGVASSAPMKEYMSGLIEDIVEHYPELLFFSVLVEQLLEFDINDTEKFDAVMGYGYSLIADKSRLIKHKKGSGVTEIKNIIPSYLLS